MNLNSESGTFQVRPHLATNEWADLAAFFGALFSPNSPSSAFAAFPRDDREVAGTSGGRTSTKICAHGEGVE